MNDFQRKVRGGYLPESSGQPSPILRVYRNLKSNQDTVWLLGLESSLVCALTNSVIIRKSERIIL